MWRAQAWFFPGLTDAATRVELATSVDLQTGRVDARLRLGLRRRFSSKGLSLVHALPLDGSHGRCKLDIGATLSMPEELELTSDDLRERRNSLRDVKLGIDFDRLDLRIMY